MKHVTEQLLTDIQQNSQHKAFGSRVAEIGIRATNLTGQDATDEVDRLRQGIKDLLESSHPRDLKSVESINWRFDTADRKLFTAETEDDLDSEVGPNMLEWLATASTSDFALFAIWNVARRHQFQARLDSKFDDYRDDALEDVERMVKAEVYPAKALELYDDTFKHYGKFKALDTFESGLMSADGYCGDTVLALANMYAVPEDLRVASLNFRRTVLHEATHGVAHNGGKHNRGFFRGIATPHEYIRTLEEYWASKTEKSVNYKVYEEEGWPHRAFIDHMGLPDRFQSYPHLREYYDTIAVLTDGLELPQLGHAYLSDRDSDEGQRIRQQIEDAIASVTGKIAFFDMNDKHEALETTEQRIAFMNSETENLSPFISFEPAAGALGVISFKE